jgi:hypothetical protein
LKEKGINMAGIYTPLTEYLTSQSFGNGYVTCSFEKIEEILHFNLPQSAYNYQSWWANEKQGSHVEAHAWLDAGWKVDTVNFQEKWARLIRN